MRQFLLTLALVILAVSPAHARQTSLIEEVIYRVSLGTVEDAEILVKKLGNPNAVDTMGWPLLAIAAARTDDKAYAMSELLVSMGAKPNYDGGRKNFPIIAAIQSDNADVVEFLLGVGANYRAVDAYGVRVVDFARQSGNKKIISLVEQAIEEDILGLSTGRSQEFFNKLVKDLAFHSCASTYYSFYYATGQDEIPAEEQQETLEPHLTRTSFCMSRLAGRFNLPASWIEDIYFGARKAVKNELENLVSNRYRREKGVGQPGDMEERCDRLTKPWQEQILDKNKIRTF
ncbi:MAG: ankyrin repeat domain-containing protein [Rickettsiales bacterium]|nr:ankyrin repeat domain-containing protein [Rickettsiales bacterium]